MDIHICMMCPPHLKILNGYMLVLYYSKIIVFSGRKSENNTHFLQHIAFCPPILCLCNQINHAQQY